jgi:hypothetical protein
MHCEDVDARHKAGHDEIKRSTTSLACDAQAKLGEDAAS